MKKVISIILTTAMVLTMMSTFAVNPVDTGYEFESYTVYEKDFNTEEKAPFSGTDLDIATKPTRWEYVDVAEGDKAIKVTYVIPTFDEVVESLPNKPVDDPATPEVDESIAEGTYKETYTQEMYDATYGATKSGYLAVTGDKGAFSEDAEAYVLNFDICFPSIPEYGASVNFWNALKQGGGRKVQNVMMNYMDTFNEDGEVVEKGDTFGFNIGGKLFPIEAETWYTCTQVIDIVNRYTDYYIDGVKVATIDISANGPLTDRGYLRVVYNTKGMEDGFLLDNIHAYEAKMYTPSVPFQYSVSGAALEFDGYSIETATSSDGSVTSKYLADAEGKQVTQLGQTLGLSSADKMSIVADPTGANNQVMKWDNTNGDAAADIYLNMGTASKYEIKDKTNNAIVFDYDVYVEDAETLGTMQPFWFTAYTPVRAINQIMMGKKTEDMAFISFTVKEVVNGESKNVSYSATFNEKEWHNVRLVYEMGTNMMTLYLDDIAFYNGSLENGAEDASGFDKLDYMRIQMGKAAKGILYFDNLHIYEASNTACAISAPDFVAGVSKVGDAISLVAESYVEGEDAVIQMSTDGKNWDDFSGIAATLTSESVYYRVKAGNQVSDVITLYGVAGAEFEKRADIYAGVIDFEPVDGAAYTIGGGAVKTPDGNILKNVQNMNFGVSAEVKTYTADSTKENPVESGSVRTTTIAEFPSTYANSEGKGKTALKVTGDGYKTLGGISQLNINLSSGGDRYPGGTDAKTIAQEGDIYVTEFDYAVDKIPTSNIQIAEFRSDANWGRYCSLWLTKEGFIKLVGTTSTVQLSAKTWHNIKVVAYSATGVVEAYVDGVLAATVTSNSGSLGYWDSFRIYGGQGNPATAEEAYYDNMNFYIAQTQVAPTASDVKLGTITYKNGDDVVEKMGAYDDLKISATLTNNGVADSVVCIFALYNADGILKTLAVEQVAFGQTEAKKTVVGILGASEANDKVKVFLWDSLGGIATKGQITAPNTSL